MMGQVGQAVQGGMSQGSSTTPSAPAAPVGNAYEAPVSLPAQLPESYQDDRMRSPQEQPQFPQQQQQPSWQQNPEWQGYQSQMQDLQNKMRTYSQQYQPPQMQQQQNDYQPRGRGGWGYGGRGGGSFGQQQGPFQGSGLAGLLGAFGGNSMFKNGGKVE
jgi:hypothetical protein